MTKLTKLNAKIKTLTNETENLKSNLDHSDKTLEEFKTKFHTAETENKKLELEIGQLKQPTIEIEQLKSKICQRDMIIDENIKQIVDLKTAKETLAQKFYNLTTENKFGNSDSESEFDCRNLTKQKTGS